MRRFLILACLATPAAADSPLRDDLGARTYAAACHYRGEGQTPFRHPGPPGLGQSRRHGATYPVRQSPRR